MSKTQSTVVAIYINTTQQLGLMGKLYKLTYYKITIQVLPISMQRPKATMMFHSEKYLIL